MANAAARSVLEGSDFGDNVVAALPDIIGNTIGNLVAGAVAGGGKMSAAEKQLIKQAEKSANGSPAASPLTTSAQAGMSPQEAEAAKYLAAYPEFAAIIDSRGAASSSPRGTVTVGEGTTSPAGLPMGPVTEVGFALDRATLDARHAIYEANKLAGYDYSVHDFAYEANYWLVGQLEARAAPTLAQTDMFFGGIMSLWAAPLAAPALAEGGLTAGFAGFGLVADTNHVLGASAPFTGATRLPLDYVAGNGASAVLDIAAVGGNALYAGYSGIQGVRAAKSGGIADLGLTELDPNIIRFSQTSPRLQGATVPKLVESMQAKGFVVEPDRLIDVVRMPDGGLTTLDNTRILAASRAGVKVQARVWEHTDLLPKDADFISRFVGRRGEIPQTFGDAVTNRISNQNSIFRNQYPYGSPFIGSNH